MNKRGSVSILVAYATPAIIVAGVFAIDLSRYWVAEARLQSALDAAALSAARDIDSATRNANAQAVFNASWNGGAPPLPGQSAGTPPAVAITEPAPGQIQVQASVDLKPLLGKVAIPGVTVPGVTTRNVTRAATAQRNGTGIELALVFDTTLSMAFNDGASTDEGRSAARIHFARKAALALTAKLFGSQTEYQPNLYISVVPFNVAVNIGTGDTQTAWMSSTVPSYTAPHKTYTWSGCVEARPGGYDSREDSPGVGDSKFRRYYWPSTYNTAQTSANTATNGVNNAFCTSYQDYSPSSNSTTGPCAGHNDWTAPTDTQYNNPLAAAARNLAGSFGQAKGADGVWRRVSTVGSNDLFGPNFMCPSVAILPLTMDRKTIENRIGEMIGTTAKPYPFGYGTVIPAGLQGAWYTLSPQWRGRWNDPNPVRANGTRLTPPTPLPLDYNTGKTKKVVLLLSDGDNNWYSAREQFLLGNDSGAGTGNNLTRPESRRTELFYNAYGNLATNRLSISIPNSGNPTHPNTTSLANDYTTVRPRADAELDAITLDLCGKMKAQGIVIYAVGIGVAENAHHNLLQSCVSPPSDESPTQKYIRTSNAADVVAAFELIANELTNLRLQQ